MLKYALTFFLLFITYGSGYAAVSDVDQDGIADIYDNCVNSYNPKQEDSDANGIGNACDADLNHDGIVNSADLGLFKKVFGVKVGNARLAIRFDYNGDGVVDEKDRVIFDQVRAVKANCITDPTIATTNGVYDHTSPDFCYMRGSVAHGYLPMLNERDLRKMQTFLGQKIIHSDPLAVKADFNHDGIVNAIDLSLLRQWTLALTGQLLDPVRADLNKDGRVNSLDIGLFKSAYTVNDPTSPKGKAIDYNSDGKLDDVDFIIFRAIFAKANGGSILEDINKDWQVDGEDLRIFKSVFGNKIVYNNPDLPLADMDGNDVVDAKDIAALTQMIPLFNRTLSYYTDYYYTDYKNNSSKDPMLDAFLSIYGSGPLASAADFNSDGMVNDLDLTILKNSFGLPPGPGVKLQKTGLASWQMGIVINDNDPYSVTVGEYYRAVRNIPVANVVHLNIPVGVVQLSPENFLPIREKIQNTLPAYVQAIAIAWVTPYRVGCNSITSAVTKGFDLIACGGVGANYNNPLSATQIDYTAAFTNIRLPYTFIGLRPSMLLAANSTLSAKNLIARGKASDRVHPAGNGYLMLTSDNVRSQRARNYLPTALDPLPFRDPAEIVGNVLDPILNVQIMAANTLANTKNVLFYFQGLSKVANLGSNNYRPGAIADNFTSYGGVLTEKWNTQTTALEYIDAGVTGTYGTVVEPYAFTNKFPDPYVVMKNYVSGKTLVETYWSSVDYVSQGLFVGDPLACPWCQ